MTAQPEAQPPDDSVPKKRGRGPGRPFPKGESANPGGRPKDEIEGWTDDGLNTLERMRKVFTQLPSADRGPPERELRKLLKRDNKAFVAQLVSLEKAEAAAKARDQGPAASVGEGAPPAPADEKTADLLALIDQLLDRHGETPK